MASFEIQQNFAREISRATRTTDRDIFMLKSWLDFYLEWFLLCYDDEILSVRFVGLTVNASLSDGKNEELQV